MAQHVCHRSNNRGLRGKLLRGTGRLGSDEELLHFTLDTAVESRGKHVAGIVLLVHFITRTLVPKRSASRFNAR